MLPLTVERPIVGTEENTPFVSSDLNYQVRDKREQDVLVMYRLGQLSIALPILDFVKEWQAEELTRFLTAGEMERFLEILMSHDFSEDLMGRLVASEPSTSIEQLQLRICERLGIHSCQIPNIMIK